MSAPIPPRRDRRLAAIAVIGLVTTLAGCGVVPADTDDTLDRVTGGDLRVGITHNPPWTDTSDSSDRPGGSEVDLVERLAEHLDAEIVWTESSEATLAEALNRGDLDLAIGGFTDDTPWTDLAAITTPYTEAADPYGTVKKHVFLARMGENRFLVSTEEFLREQGGDR